MPSPTCRNCGATCEWGDVEGKWRLFSNGQPHKCFPKTESVTTPLVATMPNQPRYDEPIEQDDVVRLARQIARLATAIEDLTDEIRELRRLKS